ncbi:MAG TPA: polyamine ABC transporter ATP-binding protein, partial [Acidaminococcaceae bacterium]|nr:polyamine ABC transporter ATP-binding protein [Acidaminococcaceae bacterium]
PEGVDLADSDGIPGTVISSTYMGNMQEYTVRVGDIDLNLEAYDPAGIKIYHAGDAVCVQFRPLNLHAIKKA